MFMGLNIHRNLIERSIIFTYNKFAVVIELRYPKLAKVPKDARIPCESGVKEGR